MLFYFHVTKYAKVSPQISLLVLSNFKQINYLLFSQKSSENYKSDSLFTKYWKQNLATIHTINKT